MSYRVAVTPTAAKEYKRLPKETQSRVRSALAALAVDPRPPGTVKLRGSRSDWRVRVGSYRILFEIDDSSSEVTVWRIAHRRQSYR